VSLNIENNIKVRIRGNDRQSSRIFVLVNSSLFFLNNVTSVNMNRIDNKGF
jgi:hypothetical protein